MLLLLFVKCMLSYKLALNTDIANSESRKKCKQAVHYLRTRAGKNLSFSTIFLGF